MLTLAGVAAAALFGWWLARRIVRPVVNLRDTAEQIASTQDLTTPIPVDGEGEVGSLARSFTTMVHALATSREQQQTPDLRREPRDAHAAHVAAHEHRAAGPG